MAVVPIWHDHFFYKCGTVQCSTVTTVYLSLRLGKAGRKQGRNLESILINSGSVMLRSVCNLSRPSHTPHHQTKKQHNATHLQSNIQASKTQYEYIYRSPGCYDRALLHWTVARWHGNDGTLPDATTTQVEWDTTPINWLMDVWMDSFIRLKINYHIAHHIIRR